MLSLVRNLKNHRWANWWNGSTNSPIHMWSFCALEAWAPSQLDNSKKWHWALNTAVTILLWSLRCCSSTDTDLNKILLDGFLDRTKGSGLVLQSWIPQVAILGHVAVRGLVSHCGWNSMWIMRKMAGLVLRNWRRGEVFDGRVWGGVEGEREQKRWQWQVRKQWQEEAPLSLHWD